MSKLATVSNTGRLALRLDRWVNANNSFGGSKDPITRTTFTRDFLANREILDSLFRYDWVTRKAIEIPAQDATRKWIDLIHDNPKRLQIAKDEMERLDARSLFEEAIILSRLYGGNIMILGVFDGNDVSMPLGVPRETHFVANVDRWLAYPRTFYQDKLDPKFGQVESYLINRPHVYGSDTSVVHESRVLKFDGNYLPPLEKIRNFTYGASVVEVIYESIRHFGITIQSGASVMQDFVTKKLKIDNLDELLNAGAEGEANLLNRLSIMAAEISINSIAVFGKDEELEKMGTPITGLPELMDRFVEIVSASVGIPRSRFFSNQSGKLGGDSGANDLRMHYDNIEAFQKNRLNRHVRRFIDVVLAPLGFEPGEIDFKWAPLWQLSETETADVRLKTAQSDQIYINSQVVQPEEVALSRFSETGINLSDMNIENEPREKFLKEFAKGEINPEPKDPNDPNDPTDPNDPEVENEPEAE